MKYINTKTISINTYGISSVNVLPYSKLLNVTVKRDCLELLISSDSQDINYQDNTKIFNFKIIKGSQVNNSFMDDNYEYFNTIRVVNDDFIEYYHIFLHEIKTLDELRNDKLETIIDNDT